MQKKLFFINFTATYALYDEIYIYTIKFCYIKRKIMIIISTYIKNI